MKNLRSKLGIGALLLLSLVMGVYAAPNTTFTWTAPTNYEDGSVIPATDILSYTIYCSNTQGGPYNFSFPAGTAESIPNLDVGACVQGVPGTYYFVATAYSPDYASESAFSGEATRTYTAIDLGKVPNPPVLVSVQ